MPNKNILPSHLDFFNQLDCYQSVTSGPGQVPVRQDQDLLPSGPGGVSGETEGGQAARRLRADAEDGPRLDAAAEISQTARRHHRHAEVHPRFPGQEVRKIPIHVFH